MHDPITKADLARATDEIRQDFRLEIQAVRGDIAQVDKGLRGEFQAVRGEMQQMETRLGQKIDAAVSHAVNVALEQNREYMGLLDEKYQHFPGQLATLRSDVDEQGRELRAVRRDLDAHIADEKIH